MATQAFIYKYMIRVQIVKKLVPLIFVWCAQVAYIYIYIVIFYGREFFSFKFSRFFYNFIKYAYNNMYQDKVHR